MDPFARGDGTDHEPFPRASGDPGEDESPDWGWPAEGPSEEPAGFQDPSSEPPGEPQPAGIGDPPPEWSGYYTYPSTRYAPSRTRRTDGGRRAEDTPYTGLGYGPPGYWAAPPAPRRGSRTALAAIAIIACFALLVAGVGGGVRAALYLRNRVGPTVGRAPGGAGARSGSGAGAVDLQGLAARFDPSIVDITGVKQDATGQTVEDDAGSGVIISRDGQVLTNNHVIEGDDQLQAALTGGSSYPLKVLGEDPTDDVALVQMEGATNLPAIDLRTGVTASMSEAVAAFGNALGRGGRPTATQGRVTNLDQTITATLDNDTQRTETLSGLIEMSAQICPGDSGGVLTDGAGRYLGIITAASSSPNPGGGNGGPPGYGGGGNGGGGNGGGIGQDQCSNDGFVIPVARVIPIVQQIRSGRRSAKVIIGVPGFLGVEVEECTEASAEEGSCQAPAVQGAQITQLVAGGAADQAGFPESFVITGIGQAQVTSPDDLTTALEQTSPGQAVQVTWNDGLGGGTKTTTVTLGAGPPA